MLLLSMLVDFRLVWSPSHRFSLILATRLANSAVHAMLRVSNRLCHVAAFHVGVESRLTSKPSMCIKCITIVFKWASISPQTAASCSSFIQTKTLNLEGFAPSKHYTTSTNRYKGMMNAIGNWCTISGIPADPQFQ